MQAIMETVFDILYLGSATFMGVIMLKNSKKKPFFKLYGIMAIILAFGDAFHLVPRSYGLIRGIMDDIPHLLGFGKFITSITMTIFYILLYHIWAMRYRKRNMFFLTCTIYLLAIIRIVLCFFPQNQWLVSNPPLVWGIYRNIPFLIMGLLIMVLYFIEARWNRDVHFKHMWLCIFLSFLFYIPVVLFSSTYPMVGMLMIPKTVAYFFIILMGYNEISSTRSHNGILM